MTYSTKVKTKGRYLLNKTLTKKKHILLNNYLEFIDKINIIAKNQTFIKWSMQQQNTIILLTSNFIFTPSVFIIKNIFYLRHIHIIHLTT